MMNSSTKTSPPSFMPLLMALGLAAIGWEVWLDIYYVNSGLTKMLWGLLATAPLLLTPRGHLVEIRMTRGSAYLHLIACGAWLLCLGLPYGIPGAVAAAGVATMLLLKSGRPRALGESLYVLGLLMCLQALLALLLIRWMGATGNIAWLAAPFATVCRWLGVDSIVNGGQLVARNAHFPWRFGPSVGMMGALWISLFVSPAALVMYFLYGVRKACAFALLGLLVLPIVRYATLVSLYLQFETVDWFFHPTINLAFLLVCLAAAAAALSRLPLRAASLDLTPGRTSRTGGTAWTVPGLLLLAVMLIVFGILCPDPGRRKGGRVLIDESHGGWEWTTEAFDRDWYGQAATYNYWCILDFISAHYATERNQGPLTPEVLKTADVLIVKTPTHPIEDSEIETITQWVRRGGGLFLIGDHTNVFGTTTCLHPLAHRFGLQYCYDSTHDLQTGSLQTGDIPALLRHPVAAPMPPRLLWGTSCSLTAPLRAEPVLIGNHIRTRYLDYGQQALFARDGLRPDERHGAILQCAGLRYGAGRVVAFTDSTIFSNFWTFFPGKAELFLGAINWLNRCNTSRFILVLGFLGGLSAVVLAGSLAGSRRLMLGYSVVALLLGIPVAIRARDLCTARWYSLPAPQTTMDVLLFDREYSSADMPDFVMQGKSQTSYQTFFTWVQRLGLVPRCVYSFTEAARERKGRIIMIRPQGELSSRHLQRLDRFFEKGGKLLILDGTNNPNSRMNLLLQRYGLAMDFHPRQGGTLSTPDSYQPFDTSISPAYEVKGGDPILLAGVVPILARVKVHQGELWACSLADTWSDAALGLSNAAVTGRQRLLSELEYWVIGQFMDLEVGPDKTAAAKRVSDPDPSE
jgi:hypothetical protein